MRCTNGLPVKLTGIVLLVATTMLSGCVGLAGAMDRGDSTQGSDALSTSDGQSDPEHRKPEGYTTRLSSAKVISVPSAGPGIPELRLFVLSGSGAGVSH